MIPYGDSLRLPSVLTWQRKTAVYGLEDGGKHKGVLYAFAPAQDTMSDGDVLLGKVCDEAG